jgi:dynein heavy chain 1
LDSFVDSLFTPRAYNVDFDLVPSLSNSQILPSPEGTKIEHFLTWVRGLPEREPPTWLSLPPTAERVIAVAQGTFHAASFMPSLLILDSGNELLGKLRKMRMLADDDDELMTTAIQKQTSQQPAWMRSLFERCREWIGLLPTVCFGDIWE